MTEVEVLFAGMPVTRFDEAAAWWERLFGRPADVVVTEGEVMWRVTDSAWVYVVAEPGRAGGGTVTLAVPDLDRAVDDLAARGLTGSPIEAVGTAGRKARYHDADGNLVAVVEIAG